MNGVRISTALVSWIMFVAFFSKNITYNPYRPEIRRLSVIEGNTTLVSILSSNSSRENSEDVCKNVRDHIGYQDACSFVQAHEQCQSGGIIDYTQMFFCKFGTTQWLGYSLLGIWLIALFYMLGNTAADYFCCSLQKLSSLLHLPPTLAGVTLLPLGNGAPDVFASIAAFVGADAGEVGLNSVLGGAVFVTMVVAGLVYYLSSEKSVHLDRYCFIRDVSFFLFTILCLVGILYTGKIHFWGAVSFLLIYLAYAITIAATEIIKKKASNFNWLQMQDIAQHEEDQEWYSPLMDPDSGEVLETVVLPQWRWASHVAIYAHQQRVDNDYNSTRPMWGWSEQEEDSGPCRGRWLASILCKAFIDWPLTLPRQLTIPLVEETQWSRPVSVSSVALAPILLAALLGDHTMYSYAWGIVVGVSFGLLAFATTSNERPPSTFLFPWVVAGFLMSIVWFYIIAKELVAVLVSLGVILDIDSSILGVTVLAWGNSMGDLMANVAMAYNGGDGVQVAVSGCYAGPMFNTLVGLGASLLLVSWHKYPSSFIIPGDTSLYYTIGFLVIGLVWTLVLLPSNRMQPSRLLGIGLLALYSCFLTFRISQSWGLFSLSS